MPVRPATPLEQTLSLIDELCTENDLSYAVIGGIAATVYGSGRTTIDVDLIVQTDLTALDVVYTAFTKVFVPLKQNPLEFFKQYYVLPLLHNSLKTKLDVSAALSEFERTALKRARKLDYGSASAFFCSPEDLILFKLVASRERDLLDVKDIIFRNREGLDLAYLRSTAKQFTEVDRSDVFDNLERFLR